MKNKGVEPVKGQKGNQARAILNNLALEFVAYIKTDENKPEWYSIFFLLALLISAACLVWSILFNGNILIAVAAEVITGAILVAKINISSAMREINSVKRTHETGKKKPVFNLLHCMLEDEEMQVYLGDADELFPSKVKVLGRNVARCWRAYQIITALVSVAQCRMGRFFRKVASR